MVLSWRPSIKVRIRACWGLWIWLEKSNLNGDQSFSRRNWQSPAALSWARLRSFLCHLIHHWTIKRKWIKAWQQEPEVQLIPVVHATEIHGTTKSVPNQISHTSKQTVSVSPGESNSQLECHIEWHRSPVAIHYLAKQRNSSKSLFPVYFMIYKLLHFVLVRKVWVSPIKWISFSWQW